MSRLSSPTGYAEKLVAHRTEEAAPHLGRGGDRRSPAFYRGRDVLPKLRSVINDAVPRIYQRQKAECRMQNDRGSVLDVSTWEDVELRRLVPGLLRAMEYHRNFGEWLREFGFSEGSAAALVRTAQGMLRERTEGRGRRAEDGGQKTEDGEEDVAA